MGTLFEVKNGLLNFNGTCNFFQEMFEIITDIQLLQNLQKYTYLIKYLKILTKIFAVFLHSLSGIIQIVGTMS